MGSLTNDNDTDAGQALYYDVQSDVPMTRGNETGGDLDETKIIREFSLDFDLPESSLPGDLPELQGYLCG